MYLNLVFVHEDVEFEVVGLGVIGFGFVYLRKIFDMFDNADMMIESFCSQTVIIYLLYDCFDFQVELSFGDII